MAKATGTLTLTVHEAKELTCKDLGKQDPYAKVSLKDEHFKTKTHKKGNSKATWNQSFLFNVKNCDHKEILHIQCWDEDLVSDDKIGRADLTLQEVMDITDEKDGKWIQIVDFNNFHKITGYIRISASVTGTGWPALTTTPTTTTTTTTTPTPTPTPTYTAPTPTYTAPTPTYTAPTPTYTSPTPTYTSPTHEHHGHEHGHGHGHHEHGHGHHDHDHGHHEHHTTPTYSPPVTTYSPPVTTYSPPVTTYSPPVTTYSAPVIVKEEKKATPKLEQGGRLDAGESLFSTNGLYRATMQHDGNFVLYKGSSALWASNTEGRGGKYVILQHDHNLVMYDGSGAAKWASNTDNRGTGMAHVYMQDDGNLVLYCGGSDASHALWASGTHQSEEKKSSSSTPKLEQGGKLDADQSLVSTNGKYRATMQGDGNFVVYKGGHPTWASNTSGSGAKYVILQGDHNLVIYDGSGSPKWASNTSGKGEGTTHIYMQDDGNLVLYAGSHPLWASNTAE